MESRRDVGVDVLQKRLVPKIGGSSAAFIAIIVILIVVIIAAGTAVVYLLREDAGVSSADEEALAGRGQRNRYRRSESRVMRYIISSRKWLARMLRIAPTSQRVDGLHPDKSSTPRQGWMPTGNDSNWDLDSPDIDNDRGLHAPKNIMMRIAERGDTGSSVGGTPRASDVDAFRAHPTRMYTSDSGSSVRFDLDPHGVRGLGYEPSSLSRQGVAPSIQSQLYSSPPASPSSSSFSPGPHQLPSRMTMTSAESIEKSSFEPAAPTNFALGSSSSFPVPSPSIRTFGSGSRFVEAL